MLKYVFLKDVLKNHVFELKSVKLVRLANISQLFLLDKLVSSQGLFRKKNFWIALLYRKIDRKITFDFTALWKGT
jgi:hypothetical protein